jgi:hypothetical protein
MNADLSAKPSYDAIATLSRLAGDGQLGGSLELGDGRYGLIFDTPRGRVTALWALEPVTWSLRFEATSVQVLGRDGRDLTAAALANASALTIQPDDGPIYLVGGVTASAAH